MPTAPEIAPVAACVERALEPLGVAVGLECEAGELEPEAGRLGVDAVGAPDAERVRVLARAVRQRGGELARGGHDHRSRALELQPERRVEHVGGREAEVDPAPGRPGGGAEHVDEGGDVVVGDGLALLHGLDGERRGADRIEFLGSRSPARVIFAERLGRGDLDVAPRGHARLVGPDGAELGSGVSIDHGEERILTSRLKALRTVPMLARCGDWGSA